VDVKDLRAVLRNEILLSSFFYDFQQDFLEDHVSLSKTDNGHQAVSVLLNDGRCKVSVKQCRRKDFTETIAALKRDNKNV
jgi:hypothetical protein